jgi:hypothetical protein
MNRQKKLQQLFKAKAKKASAKLAPKSKDKYISKADREKLEAEAAQAPDSCAENFHAGGETAGQAGGQ